MLPYIVTILIFYVLGAYATTDIKRLSEDSSVSVTDGKCYCPHCHYEIPLWRQIPLLSYIFSKGKCANCAAPIPYDEPLLEAVILLGCTLIIFAGHFSIPAIFLTAIFYESVKTVYLLRKGIRRQSFLKQLLMSLLFNLFLFILIGLILLICRL